MNTGSLKVEGILTLREQMTPAAPAQYWDEIYFKADGNLYVQNYASVEQKVVLEAPTDGTIYGRCNGAWVDVPNSDNWTSNVCGNGYTLTDVGCISANGPIIANAYGCSCYIFTGVLGYNLGGCDAGGYFGNNYNNIYTYLSTYDGWGVFTNGPIHATCICANYLYGDGGGLTNLVANECLCGLCDVSIPSNMAGNYYGYILCWNGSNWNIGCSGGCGGWYGCACSDLNMQEYSICCAYYIYGCCICAYSFYGDGSNLCNVNCACCANLAYYACYLCSGYAGGWCGGACSDLYMNGYSICSVNGVYAFCYSVQGYSGTNSYWMDGNYNWHCTCNGIMIF